MCCGCPIFLIHRFAWPCGSMQSGHRRALSTTIPFSTLNESFGRPAMIHARILTGSPKHWTRLNFSDPGTSLSIDALVQSVTAASRNSGVKAPKYAIRPLATSTSPVRLLYSRVRSLAFCVHRVFSPPSEAMSVSARSSLVSQSRTCAVRSSCSFRRSASLVLRPSSWSTTFCSSARFSFSFSITEACAASASRRDSFLGATTLATRS
mmetsp:Transcript_15452/g.43939  ORF Transcript_15452/g.43939 Transcript_15452/m.43939 type:complete len:208 (-) Transcript_15452:3243-3866(-)